MTDAQFKSLRLLLALVAAGLFFNAAAVLVGPSPARAGDVIDCRITEPIEIRSTNFYKDRFDIGKVHDAIVIEKIERAIEVELNSSSPGTRRSDPLYVKMVD